MSHYDVGHLKKECVTTHKILKTGTSGEDITNIFTFPEIFLSFLSSFKRFEIGHFAHRRKKYLHEGSFIMVLSQLETPLLRHKETRAN